MGLVLRSQSAHLAAFGEADCLVGVHLDKLLYDALVCLDASLLHVVAHISQTCRLQQAVGEHAAACGFEIVARVFNVEHIIPHTRFLVLILHGVAQYLCQQVDDLLTSGVVFGQSIENLHERHGKPSLRASPCVLAQTCLLVCPEHVVGLVPGVLPQPCLLVVGALVGLCHLHHGIVVHLLGVLAEIRCRCGVEGQSHEYSVEPHLLLVYCLVPPHSLVGAWLLLELAEKGFYGCEVLLLGV